MFDCPAVLREPLDKPENSCTQQDECFATVKFLISGSARKHFSNFRELKTISFALDAQHIWVIFPPIFSEEQEEKWHCKEL